MNLHSRMESSGELECSMCSTVLCKILFKSVKKYTEENIHK